MPVVLLMGGVPATWDPRATVAGWKGVVAGFGPAKGIVAKDPAGQTSVAVEMEHFLYTRGVDAVFTDSPDKFPHRP